MAGVPPSPRPPVLLRAPARLRPAPPRRVLPGSVAAAAETMPRLEVQLGLDAGVGVAEPTWSTVTQLCTMADWELSGRQYELGATEAGKAGLTLRNDTGTYDPTSNPTIKPYRHLRIRARLTGQDYNLWRGYVERWPQRWVGKAVGGMADITGVDRLAILAGGRVFGSALANEILLDTPIGYYPLGEDQDSETAGNLATTTQPPARLRASKYGAGTVEFGADGLPADPATALSFSAATLTVGSLLELGNAVGTAAGGPFLTNSGGWTVELWFKISGTPANTYSLANQRTSTSNVDWNAFMRTDGTLGFTPTDGTPSTAAAYNDGIWHHVLFTMASNGRTYHVYVDGAQVLTATNAAADTFNSPGNGTLQVGGIITPAGLPGSFSNGTLAHVALYQAELSSARALAHYQAGFTAFSGEGSGARILRLLRYARHVGTTNLDTGASTLSGATTIDGQNPAQALQDVATWEAGAIIATGDGQMTFHARTRRYNTTAVCTFGGAGGSEIDYTDLTPELSPDKIVNRAEFDRIGGGSYATEDATSINDYGLRVLSRTYGVSSDLEVIDAARYTVDRNAQPTTRVESIQVALHGQPTTVQAILLGLKFGDRVTVKRRPQGAPTITLECFIEQVAHRVRPGVEWWITYQLSPADEDAYWQLEVAGKSELGTTTRLSY